MLLKFTNSLGRKGFVSPFILKWILKIFGPPHLGTRIRLRLLSDALKDLNLPENAQVLDAGSGYGLVSSFLAGKRLNVTGIDTDINRLKVARAITNSGLLKPDFIKANIYNLPFKNSSFRLCICLEVLEHLIDDKKAIKEMARVLKEDGYLVVSVPELTNNQKGIDKLGHIRPGYTITQLRKIFKQDGFQIKYSTPIGDNFWGKNLLNIDLKLSEITPILSAVFSPILGFLINFEHLFYSNYPPYSLFVVFKKKG